MSDKILDKETIEQFWKDPDWTCPHCKFVNKAIREKCRNCAYIGGEVFVFESAIVEVI